MSDEINSVEREEDFGKDSQGIVKRWLAALSLARKEQAKWEERAEKVLKRYRDDRGVGDESKRFNVLWSNTETLKPALYARMPKPQVSRRYKDRDPVGRQAAMVLERALEYHLDAYDFNSVVRAGRDDYLLPGRAVARVRYVPTYGPEETPIEYQEDEFGGLVAVEGEPYQPVVYEEAQCEYVYWKDFLHGPARKWEEVPWVAFRSYLTHDQLEDRFGEELAKRIKLDYTPTGIEDRDELPKDLFCKAEVWEIWNKEGNEVIWIAKSHPEPLDISEPPLNLHGFFPCKKPLLSLTTNDSLIPIPEYTEYQDQADELDELTGRINSLVKSLKVGGLYAADAEEIKQLLTEGMENVLIPVENWAMFAERGGIDGAVTWMPIEQVAKVVIALYEAREKTKQELYEITGLSDIIRGSSNAQETATAQRIKGQFASLRLTDRQNAIAEWVRDLLRLKAEVIAEHFSADTLQQMTGLQVDEQVMALLQNDALRSFRIDIETDSTIQPDEQADKEARVEFLTAVSSFLERAIPAGQAMPELVPLLGEMLMFGVRGFRAGRELEDKFEEAMEAISQRQPQQNSDPEAEAKAQKIQEETKQVGTKTQLMVMDFQKEQERKDAESQSQLQKDRVDMATDIMEQKRREMDSRSSDA